MGLGGGNFPYTISIALVPFLNENIFDHVDRFIQ